ncbi:MAG: ABC transporter permease [Bdellovibrio sp.]|nr:MAG: ABC transporter permease [Bdellovibrio sp.]
MKTSFWPPFVLVCLFLGILEISVDQGWLSAYLVPAPSHMALELKEDAGSFARAFLESAATSFAGLFMSLVFGLSLAFLFSLSSLVRQAVYPFTLLFQTVPIVAIAPLLVIWFGFGPVTVRTSAFIVSVFPVLANTLMGLEQVPTELQELFFVLKSTRWQQLLRLALPHALPAIFAGLRMAAGLSVIGSIVGEFIAGGGLGSLIDSARMQQRVDIVFSAVFLSAILGLILVKTVDLCQALVARQRPYFLEDA